MILRQIESTRTKDNKFHIIAPPGSGKTIVGIELIKQFGSPAVVFAPTSTIQLQWKEKVKMFIPEGSNLDVDDIASIDQHNLRPINIFTYQLISSPAENLQFAEEAALIEWANDLLTQGSAANLEEAKERIALLQKNNQSAYSKELTKYYKKIKSEYLNDPTFDGTQFLHENARKLIDELVAAGVKVVVMDEVHHLLDYWAIVLKELLKRIGDAKLIGLTATPPLSADETELENYLSLMGSIDFEIPTPAVVKEGNLAPYQDLVFFCKPTAKEKEFIDSMQKRFQDLIQDIGKRNSFYTWVHKRIIKRPLKDIKKQEWTSFFNSHPFLAVAGVKYLNELFDERIPGDIVITEEMEQELNIDDWVYLLTDYSLNFLKVSEAAQHHEELKEIIGVLKSFGFVLTEQGMRQLRSPSDSILALSEAKNHAVVNILKHEMQTMKENLRAVVITDFEKESATVTKYLSDVLDDEAGGAVRAFRHIAHDPETTKLEPILVTGTTVLMDVDETKEILKKMKEWRDNNELKFEIETKPTQHEKIVEVIGHGPDWRTNTYVRMVTDLFDQGIIRCIVGTRGLLGEGWDSLSLNTLIDLTTATTSMTVNQIRGRSIRLDPKQPQKVANNWDVVCIDEHFEKGDQDFKRFVKKHQKFYGLGSKNKIIKGILHVDEQLALQYQTIGFKKIGYGMINSRMMAKSANRAKIYAEWEIGKGYSNFEYSTTKLDGGDINFQTAFTLKESLRVIFNSILTGMITFTLWYVYFVGYGLDFVNNLSTVFFVLVTLFVCGMLMYVGHTIRTYFRKAFIEVPIDSFLLDIGKALLKSLRETGLIDSSQSVDNVRVVQDASGYYDLYIDYASTEDAHMFSQCLREVLGPVINQRYVVSRSEDDIKLGFYTPIWWTFRKMFRLFKQERTAYHPVPSVLATHKNKAEIFAQNWKMYVGGGDLLYTRSAQGAELLLDMRSYNRHKIKRMSYEIWK